MAFGHVDDLEAGRREQPFRLRANLLAVLQRAGAVVGDALPGGDHRRAQPELAHQLGDVARERRDGACRSGELRVLAEHEAVILHRGAAPRRVDHDRIEAARADLAVPGQDVGARGVVALLPQMMRQRAAAAGAARHHHLAAVPGQQPDRGLVDLRRQHALGAAVEDRHAPEPLAECREHLRPVDRGASWHPRRRQRQQPAQLAGDQARGQEDERPAEPGRLQCRPEQQRPRQHEAQQPAHGAIRPRAHVGLLDVLPGVIDEVHVVHPRRAGGHAAQAGQAAIDVLDHLLGRRAVVFQHVLDQVDAAARAIELVAEQRVGRTGRGAEAAMHAGAQDLGGLRGVGIGELGRGEAGLHDAKLPAACGLG